ncbi:MAG TPA: PEP-CTERM sorting domain-containing protein [Methylophilaceae bacterium]|nr:PEP-CTERM sorting domain-containing protein [Methylophilaceae bacterium]
MKLTKILLAISATLSLNLAQAATIDLSTYTVSTTHALDIFNGTTGPLSGLEASAVTYAADRNSLFFVGDEGTGVIEVSLTGQTLGYMYFDWTGTGSNKHDTEGLTYLGNGELVVGEERLQDAYKFTYSNGGTATLANNFVSISNTSVGNNGMEGISYDPRNGTFVSVKQISPEDILAGSLTFSAATGGLPATLPSNGVSPTGGGVSTMTTLFNPSSLGLASLSDVQTLGILGSDDLLILSLDSRKLVTADRSGNVKSSFDLSNVLPHNAIEGVTVDSLGNIYLVAEQIQDGSNLPLDPNPKSQLIVLTAAVPEADTYAMLLAGLGIIGFVARRKQA